jgi:hypothetical protein
MQRLKQGLTHDQLDPGGAGGGMAWGAVNSGAHLVGTVLDLISRPSPRLADLDPNKPLTDQAGRTTPTKTEQHLQDAAAWLKSGGEPEGFWQNVGQAGEQVLEFLGTDGILKLAGPAAGTLEAGEHLNQAQQVAKVLKAHPRLAGLAAVGLKASKDATMMATQTYLHTEDPTDAAIAGVTGGVVRAGAEGVGAIGRALLARAPKTVSVAGHEALALASQVGEEGELTGTNAAGAPKIAAGQQELAQKVLRTEAQGAAERALNRVNATRPVYAPVEGRPLLGTGAPAGDVAPAYAYDTSGRMSQGASTAERGGAAQQFTFKLEGPPTEEGTTGPTVQKPGAAANFEPTASRVPEGGEPGPQNVAEMGSQATTVPSRLQKRTQAFTSATEAGAEDVARGGGPLETTDPHEAEAWLQHYEEVRASPHYDDLPINQQLHIDSQIKSLNDQLGLYHSSPYAQRFSPADVPAALKQIRTYGDAAAQVQAAVRPVYKTLDSVSGGEFGKLRNVVKTAQKVIRNPSSLEAAEAAQTRIDEANEKIEGLFTRHGAEVSPEDFRAAQSAWRDSLVLSNLHAQTERMMNGVTASEAADKLAPRIMTGNTKAFNRWLDKGTNRADAERVVGKEGVANFKRISLLLSSQSTAKTAAAVAKQVFMQAAHHAGRFGSFGGIVGGTLAHWTGVDPVTGVAAGAGVEAGVRFVLRQATINPNVGKMLDFAARNNMNPAHYAPMIARAITAPLEGESKPADSEKPETEEH